MARKSKKTTKKQEKDLLMDTENTNLENAETEQENVTAVTNDEAVYEIEDTKVETPEEETPKKIKQPIKKRTVAKAAPTQALVKPPDEKEVIFDTFLKRYNEAVTAFNSGATKKRPVMSFIGLTEIVIRLATPKIYNKMLDYFIKEVDGMASSNNALNGIETINDATVKTKTSTIYVVFSGLAKLKKQGRRPTFTIGAIRPIMRSEKFVNWVNVAMSE